MSSSPKVVVDGESCLDLEVLHSGDGVVGGGGDQDGLLFVRGGPQQDQQHPGLPEVSHEGCLRTKVALIIEEQCEQFTASACSDVLTQVSVNH